MRAPSDNMADERAEEVTDSLAFSPPLLKDAAAAADGKRGCGSSRKNERTPLRLMTGARGEREEGGG